MVYNKELDEINYFTFREIMTTLRFGHPAQLHCYNCNRSYRILFYVYRFYTLFNRSELNINFFLCLRKTDKEKPLPLVIFRGLKRCLSWMTNIALVSEPKCEESGGVAGVLANEYSCTHGAQINFRDLTSYLTYDST